MLPPSSIHNTCSEYILQYQFHDERILLRIGNSGSTLPFEYKGILVFKGQMWRHVNPLMVIKQPQQKTLDVADFHIYVQPLVIFSVIVDVEV